MITTATEQLHGSEILTNSCLNCFKSCRRKFYFAYEKGWRPICEIETLRFGEIIHFGIDAMAKYLTLAEIETEVRSRYEFSESELKTLPDANNAITKLRYECETAICLLKGYWSAWWESTVQIIQSESVFNLPIINPETGGTSRTFEQGGKRDRLAKLPDGRLALVETKTTSENIEPGSDYRNVLGLNSQICMYFEAYQAEGIDVETTLYDVIKKPSIRPSLVALTDEAGLKIVLDTDGNRVCKKDGEPRQTADTEKGYVLQTREMTPQEWSAKLTADIASRPEFYFQRFEVPLLQTDREQFRTELWEISQDLLACRNKGRWYRNTSSCRQWNRLCSYYPLCSGQLSSDNGVPTGFRVADILHEELVEE